MKVELPVKVNLPAAGEDKAGEANLREGYGLIRLGLYFSTEVRRQLCDTDEGRLQIFASVVSPSAPGAPTMLQLSAEREGTAANDYRRQPVEVPAAVEALVIALGGRVRTEVTGVSRDPDVSLNTAVETH